MPSTVPLLVGAGEGRGDGQGRAEIWEAGFLTWRSSACRRDVTEAQRGQCHHSGRPYGSQGRRTSSPGERAKATLGPVLEAYHSPGRQEGERTPDRGAATQRHKGVEVCCQQRGSEEVRPGGQVWSVKARVCPSRSILTPGQQGVSGGLCQTQVLEVHCGRSRKARGERGHWP